MLKLGLEKAEEWEIKLPTSAGSWKKQESSRENVFLEHPVLGVHWKDWCWSWNSSTLATWCKELTRWKRPSCWERLRTGGEGDDGGWDGWMASPTRCTWVGVDSGSSWWTGKPGLLRFLGHKESDTTERLNWTEEKDNLRKVENISDCSSGELGLSQLWPSCSSVGPPWSGT